ncbi:MAG: SDR family NAD(P)-dependent oxidoreductase [Deltaproteobacteria bacterium]|nr:SDR family NAD(P)-dependent oxidoreductase [Deltaproteobacteria bacterium]
MSIFTGKIAMVTGSASGIGQGLAEALAGEGARVIATDINIERLEANINLQNRSGNSVRLERLDVTDYGAFKKMIEDVVSQEGRLDYIFNNAGIAIAGDLRDVTIEHWHQVLDVNLNGVLYGALLAYQQMGKQGFGHIVNLSSIEGLLPFPTTASYVTSKFAVMGLSQSMWVEGADLGIRVSAVCPGFVRTDIFDVSPMINMSRDEWLKANAVWERFAVTPEKCAKIILKGVAKNKPIIMVTGLAHVMWRLSRINPSFLLKTIRKEFAKWRHKARLSE